MTRLSKLIAATAIAVTSSAAPTRAAEPAEPPSFPVMIWDMCPGDPAVIHEIKECGFTVAGFAAPAYLDAVHKEGMQAIVSDARVSNYDWRNVDEAVARKNVESLIAEVGSHPAVFGYYLRDEPPAGFFPGLEKVAAVVREKAPGKWPYINLFPNYATPGQLEAKDYTEYVDNFVATCKPPTLSYDHYALLDNGALRGGYFNNLRSMRDASVKYKIPFWNIVLANAHFSYREPSLADLRFEVYTTLAYGGKGLAYFTYFAPKVGNYRAAAIDQFGHKTPTWDNLRNVNLQVKTLAPTLLKLTSTRVYHLGKNEDATPPGDDSLITGGDGEFLVGEFKHEDGSDYVMIVNKNVTHSRVGANVAWRTPPKSLTLISPYVAGQSYPFDGEQVWLAPGAGVLLKVGR